MTTQIPQCFVPTIFCPVTQLCTLAPPCPQITLPPQCPPITHPPQCPIACFAWTFQPPTCFGATFEPTTTIFQTTTPVQNTIANAGGLQAGGGRAFAAAPPPQAPANPVTPGTLATVCTQSPVCHTHLIGCHTSYITQCCPQQSVHQICITQTEVGPNCPPNAAAFAAPAQGQTPTPNVTFPCCATGRYCPPPTKSEVYTCPDATCTVAQVNAAVGPTGIHYCTQAPQLCGNTQWNGCTQHNCMPPLQSAISHPCCPQPTAQQCPTPPAQANAATGLTTWPTCGNCLTPPAQANAVASPTFCCGTSPAAPNAAATAPVGQTGIWHCTSAPQLCANTHWTGCTQHSCPIGHTGVWHCTHVPTCPPPLTTGPTETIAPTHIPGCTCLPWTVGPVTARC